jgi:hypothetical protein
MGITMQTETKPGRPVPALRPRAARRRTEKAAPPRSASTAADLRCGLLGLLECLSFMPQTEITQRSSVLVTRLLSL